MVGFESERFSTLPLGIPKTQSIETPDPFISKTKALKNCKTIFGVTEN